MWKNLPELLINGASLFLVGREFMDNSRSKENWQQMYHAKENELVDMKNEARSNREEIRELHGQYIELMGQVSEIEENRSNIYRSYLGLIEQIEELGYRVSEVGQVIVPEEDRDTTALADILDEDDEDL